MSIDTSGYYGEYRVHLSSRPGFYEQYSGHVDVHASSREEAIERAFRELKRTAFPDRDRSMWRIEKVEPR